MKVLLDTHALVWFWLGESNFTPNGRAILEDDAATLFVSAASAYEIAFKRPRDRELQKLPEDLVSAAHESGLVWRSVEPADASAAGRLPRLHGDPFDRILVAQAVNLGCPIMTKDGAIKRYAVSVIW